MLTLEKIKEAASLLPQSPFNPFSLSLCGFRICEAPEIPVIKLRPECPVSDEFRAEFDAWLLQMFGARSPVPYRQAFIMGDMVIMRPSDIVALWSMEV